MIDPPRRDFFRAAAKMGLALGLAAAGQPLFAIDVVPTFRLIEN